MHDYFTITGYISVSKFVKVVQFWENLISLHSGIRGMEDWLTIPWIWRVRGTWEGGREKKEVGREGGRERGMKRGGRTIDLLTIYYNVNAC